MVAYTNYRGYGMSLRFTVEQAIFNTSK